jgi:uncharacterized protein YecT (DUF1311 family)
MTVQLKQIAGFFVQTKTEAGGVEMIVPALLLGLAPALPAAADPCAGTDTASMARCMDGKIEQATARLRQYRSAAYHRFQDEGADRDPATAKALENSAVIGDAFRATYCDAVYQRWIEGSIRYAMHQDCTLRMLNRQTHDLWSDFLGGLQDDAVPLLPEPRDID